MPHVPFFKGLARDPRKFLIPHSAMSSGARIALLKGREPSISVESVQLTMSGLNGFAVPGFREVYFHIALQSDEGGSDVYLSTFEMHSGDGRHGRGRHARCEG